MQSVPRSSSGIYTASIAFAPPTSRSHLRVPSLATVSPTIAGTRISASRASASRVTLARSVIASTRSARRRWIQRNACLARNGFSPRSAKNAASAAGSKSRRLIMCENLKPQARQGRGDLQGNASFRALRPRGDVFALPAVDLLQRKEEFDLRLCRLRTVRTVDCVGVDTPGEAMSNSTKLMPSCFFAAGSVRTRQKIQSALSA